MDRIISQFIETIHRIKDDKLEYEITINEAIEQQGKAIENFRNQVKELYTKRISQMKDDSGVQGCTYGDTDYDSISVVYGYNLAIEDVIETVKKLTN